MHGGLCMEAESSSHRCLDLVLPRRTSKEQGHKELTRIKGISMNGNSQVGASCRDAHCSTRAGNQGGCAQGRRFNGLTNNRESLDGQKCVRHTPPEQCVATWAWHWGSQAGRGQPGLGEDAEGSLELAEPALPSDLLPSLPAGMRPCCTNSAALLPTPSKSLPAPTWLPKGANWTFLPPLPISFLSEPSI